MSKTYLHEKELTQKCPCGYSILSFPNTLNKLNVLWSFNSAYQDLGNSNKYYASFQGYVNGTLKYELNFECIATPEKHICNVTRLVDKTENTNCNRSV